MSLAAAARKGFVEECQPFAGWKVQTLAGLGPRRGGVWHSLPQKFASGLLDQPLMVLCELGGWKTGQTVLRCCPRADPGVAPEGVGVPAESSLLSPVWREKLADTALSNFPNAYVSV